MDFLKDIVKEIGDDYTKLAADIDETETYVDTGSYIFNALFQVAYLAVYLAIRLLLLLESLVLERLSFLSPLLRIFLILTPMVIVSTLILKPLLINPYLSLGVLTLIG